MRFFLEQRLPCECVLHCWHCFRNHFQYVSCKSHKRRKNPTKTNRIPAHSSHSITKRKKECFHSNTSCIWPIGQFFHDSLSPSLSHSWWTILRIPLTTLSASHSSLLLLSDSFFLVLSRCRCCWFVRIATAIGDRKKSRRGQYRPVCLANFIQSLYISTENKQKYAKKWFLLRRFFVVSLLSDTSNFGVGCCFSRAFFAPSSLQGNLCARVLFFYAQSQVCKCSNCSVQCKPVEKWGGEYLRMQKQQQQQQFRSLSLDNWTNLIYQSV